MAAERWPAAVSASNPSIAWAASSSSRSASASTIAMADHDSTAMLSLPLVTLVRMELTPAQRRVVEHDGSSVRVAGGPGCGKTTALLARYLSLVGGGHRPSTILVVCHDRAAAIRFRDAVLPGLTGGFDALPITTWFGVAFDLVTRERGPSASCPHRSSMVASGGCWRRESPADWPEYGNYLGPGGLRRRGRRRPARPAAGGLSGARPVPAAVRDGPLRAGRGRPGPPAGRRDAGLAEPGGTPRCWSTTTIPP